MVVEDTSDIQRKAWQQMAEEEGKRAPPQFLLQRAEGMKNDQVDIPTSASSPSPSSTDPVKTSRQGISFSTSCCASAVQLL